MKGSESGAKLAAYLRRLRESNELSQRELALRVGLANEYTTKRESSSAVSQISKFENAHLIPRPEIVAEYAKLPGADHRELDDLVSRAQADRPRVGRPPRQTDDEASDAAPLSLPWWRHTAVLVAVAAVVVAGIVWLVIAEVIDRGSSELSVLYARDGHTIVVHACPNTECSGKRLPNGAMVKMICFRDAQDVSLNYSSPRWFDIEQPNSNVHGWVHSSQVSRQTAVGRC